MVKGNTENSVTADILQQRISDLEAMNAELKADKERLHSLLETAQANLAREQALRSRSEDIRHEPTHAQASAGKSASVRKPQQADFPLDSWEKLKRWFFNA